MEFAIINDVHLGPVPFYKGTNRIMSAVAEEVLGATVEALNKERDLAFVIQLGDLIQDNVKTPSATEDEGNFRRALQILSRLTVPVLHVCGNHDAVNMGYERLCSLIGQRQLFYSLDIEGFHIIALYCESTNHSDVHLPEPILDWLRADLKKTALPTIVFSHQSFADIDLRGHYWFEGTPERCLANNRAEVRSVFEQSGKVLAVLNGHLHTHNLTNHAQIPYFTFQSMVENFCGEDIPAATYAVAEISADRIQVKVAGNQPVSYDLAILSPT